MRCLPSQRISSRRPCSVLGLVSRCDSERIHESTLYLAISIPTTIRLFSAIIQLPSLLDAGSKPMQLFGLRKTPELSLALPQALPLVVTGSVPANGRSVRTARSLILPDFFDTRSNGIEDAIRVRGEAPCLTRH